MKMKNIFKKIAKNDKRASFFALKIGLAPISAVLLLLSAELCSIARSDPETALYIYPEMFGYVFGSLLLLLFGAVMLDSFQKDR